MNDILKTIVGEDPFWQTIIENYINEHFKGNKEYALSLMQEISKDYELLNKLCKSIQKNTFKLEQDVNIDVLQASYLANKNPNKNIIEIYYAVYSAKTKKPMIYFEEYNVNPENKNKETISIYNDFINNNGEIMFDKAIIDRLKEILYQNKETILNLCSQLNNSYKGGRQKILIINDTEINNIPIRFAGNTTNEDIGNFYNRLKDSILAECSSN